MSFHVLKSEANLRVGGLFLKSESIRTLELQSFSATMTVDGASTCTCIPFTGRHNTGFEIRPEVVANLKPWERCEVIANVQTDDGNFDKTVFVGRVLATDINVHTNAVQSSSGLSIVLRHVAEADLMGTALGQRVYYKTGEEVHPFRMDESIASTIENTALQTSNLRNGKIAAYLKELINALLKWYTNNQLGPEGYNVDEILKAVPCTVRQEIMQVVAAAGSSIHESLPSSFVKGVDAGIKGALSSKSTLLSLLSTLATFGVLSLIPTREALVISPVLDVTQFSESEGPMIKRKWITGVQNPYAVSRFPIERVVLNKKFGSRYLGPDVSKQASSKLQSVANRYSYPMNESLGALLVDPPPILSTIVDCASRAGEQGTEVKTIDEGGNAKTTVNTAGAKPLDIPADIEQKLGEKAARLMWSKLAFSNHSVTMNIIPHWIFGTDYQSDIRWTYDPKSPWGMLAHTVAFAMPFKTAVRNTDNVEDDTIYVGYVKSMRIEASVENAHLTASATLTNVRTKAEDSKYASASSANPLYDTTAGQQPE